MKSVAEIADDIVAREGGFVNDPDDPGGPTKYGVTLGTMQRLGIDLNKDGRVNTTDVRRVDRIMAAKLFVDHYFRKPRIAELPDVLHASVFDMYVNSGANAIRILQRLLREMGKDVVVDGLIGPQSIGAAEEAWREAPDYLCDAYGIARRNYYYALGDRRPASRKYCRRRDGGKGGWITRAEEFMRPKYHLTNEEHRARCAGWG
jgi:lysozyme family protein